MRFPSKVTSYNDSIISKFPLILIALRNCDMTPNQLYEAVKKKGKFSTIKEFTDILDCLFILEKIELKESGVLHYVEKN